MPDSSPFGIDEPTTPQGWEDYFVLDKVLKSGEYGRTERVIAPDGSLYIRKHFVKESRLAPEWEFLAALDAPEFPKVYAHYEIDDHYVFVMEHLQGSSLQEFIKASGPFSEHSMLELALELSRALERLHSIQPQPLIHRDIKPANIILSGGTAKLIDFGAARFFKQDKDRDTQYVGTVGYAAPEQFGFGQTDVRTDIYGLGMVMLFMLTGDDPDREARSSLASLPRVSAETKRIIERCIQFDPVARYADIDEVVADIAATLDGLGIDQHIAEIPDARNEEPAVAVAAPVAAPPSPTTSPTPVAVLPPQRNVPNAYPAVANVQQGLEKGGQAAKRFWGLTWKISRVVITIFTVMLCAFALIDPLVEHSQAGPYDDFLLLLEYLILILVLICPLYILVVNPFKVVDRIRFFSKKRVLKIILIAVVLTLITGVALNVVQVKHTQAFNTETGREQAVPLF